MLAQDPPAAVSEAWCTPSMPPALCSSWETLGLTPVKHIRTCRRCRTPVAVPLLLPLPHASVDMLPAPLLLLPLLHPGCDLC